MGGYCYRGVEYAACTERRHRESVSGTVSAIIDRHYIEEICAKVVSEFSPKRIVLFGSYAYGAPTPDSDVDLLVMLPFEGKSLWKSLEIPNRVDPHCPVDLLARRPDDVARRYDQGDPLIRDALDRGRIIYERGR